MISNQFAQRIRDVHGQEGNQWLDRLGSVLSHCEVRWSLRILPPFEPLSYNYVAPAVHSDGTQVVIKACVPHPDFLTELGAIRVFDGNGAVRLLDADPERGVLLLERLIPGERLSMLADDEQATSAAMKVMRQLWRPAPVNASFPSVTDWASGLARLSEQFGGGTGPFPLKIVRTAEALFADLIGSMSDQVLLHGDLHHENILSSDRQPWLAIDPKGVVGEPEYEVGSILRNPLPDRLMSPNPRELLTRRVDQAVDQLRFNRERVLGWAVAQAVLAAWWQYEDHGHGFEPCLACADLLEELRKQTS